MAGGNVAAFAVIILAALLNGSFAAVSKIPIVRRANVHPIVFNFYVSIGVLLGSYLSLIGLHDNKDFVDSDSDASTAFAISVYGVLGGCLLELALVFSFLAIPLVGLSLAQGVWGGTAILVSFVWGLTVFDETIKIIPLAAVGLLLLIVGVLGIAFCVPIGKLVVWRRKRKAAAAGEQPAEQHITDRTALLGGGANGDAAIDVKEGAPSAGKGFFGRALGFIFAIAVGLTGGSVLVPTKIEEKYEGIAFLPGFGVGAVALGAVLLLLYVGYRRMTAREEPIVFAPWPVLPAGLVSGLLWSGSNLGALYAIPKLGYSVAYPIYQCAIFFAGLWGIFVFKEISGVAVQTFFLAGAILIGGAACLAASE
mmetsp:Transcript_10227/g.37645  ORF Transcript_10227/g.37645 Transcript_10227/m.37645 type:complete len:366 (-) Transcript_10227:898-1995(-)